VPLPKGTHSAHGANEQLHRSAQPKRTAYQLFLSDQQWAAADKLSLFRALVVAYAIDLLLSSMPLLYASQPLLLAFQQSSLLGKPYLLTCIAGSDRVYGQHLWKLSKSEA